MHDDKKRKRKRIDLFYLYWYTTQFELNKSLYHMKLIFNTSILFLFLKDLI